MTRRPRRGRPPRLDPPTPPRAQVLPKPRVVSARRSLVGARLAGVASPIGRSELEALVAGVAAGSTEASLGLDLAGPDRGRPAREEVWDALVEGWGCDPRARVVEIAVDRTVAAAGTAAARLAEIGAAGGSVALATSRPASMLGWYQELATHLEGVGVTVLRSNAAAVATPSTSGNSTSGRGPARSIWWVGGVAVVTDGRSIRADDGVGLTDDWLFGAGRPDLVVADRGFAAAAAEAGHLTLAPADLDAVALEVAARRGAPLVTIPVDCGRPPEAYRALLGLLVARLVPQLTPQLAPQLGGAGPEGRPAARLEPDTEARPSHSTTPTPGAYAAPESGGEG